MSLVPALTVLFPNLKPRAVSHSSLKILSLIEATCLSRTNELFLTMHKQKTQLSVILATIDQNLLDSSALLSLQLLYAVNETQSASHTLSFYHYCRGKENWPEDKSNTVLALLCPVSSIITVFLFNLSSLTFQIDHSQIFSAVTGSNTRLGNVLFHQ